MNFPEFQKWIAALCAWKEARGENVNGDRSIGMRAVIHVINNRSKVSGKSWAAIVYQKLQFTSMTFGSDPELTLVPSDDDQEFATAYRLADLIFTGADTDITEGATHYFNPAVVLPGWARSMTKTVSIGHHDFYKQV